MPLPRSFRYLPACTAAVSLCFCQPLLAQRQVAEAALDVYTPVALDQQRFAGVFSNRSRANLEGYLEHIDEKALLAPFRSRDTAPPTEIGMAEGPGLFLIAAANSYESTDDVQLKGVMRQVVAQILRAQEPDGYLGMYAGEARWSPGDVLTQAATLLGLLSYSHVTGEDDSGNAARRAVDLIIAQFEKHKGPMADAPALLPVLSDLYQFTGDPKYLSFSRQLADISAPMGTPLVTILRGYGLVELYRLTGDDAHLKSAEHTWQQMQDSHPSVTGVPGAADHLDGCLTLAWFQLTLDLFRITGQPHYAAVLEDLVYNALLPSQEVSTGNIDPAIEFGGHKKFEHSTEVCSTATAVAISELANISWGRYGYGLAVLSYNPGRASLRLRRRATVQLYSESDYPASGSVLLHVEPTHDVRFPLRLLVPAWTHSFRASIGDTKLNGQPGQFLILNREWRRGDTVKISIEMTASIVHDPQDGSRVAVRRGPQLLALAKEDGASQHLALSPNALNDMPSPAGAPLASGQERFKVAASENGQRREITLVPFADSVSSAIWFAPET